MQQEERAELEMELDREEKERLEQDKKHKEIVKKADFFTSIVLFILGIVILILSLQMPLEELTGSKDMWYASPGLFPGFVAVVLMICSVILFLSADYRHWGGMHREDWEKIKGYLKGSQFVRLVIAVALLAVYVFGLLGHISYYAATFLYLFCTMVIFRPQQETKKKSIGNLLVLLVVTAVVTALVGLGFAKFAQIPLP